MSFLRVLAKGDNLYNASFTQCFVLVPFAFYFALEKMPRNVYMMLNAQRSYMLPIRQIYYEVINIFCEGIFSQMMSITFFTMDQNFEVMF